MQLWKTKSIEETEKLEGIGGIKAHDKEINHVAIGKDDMTIATASHDRTVKIWKRKDEAPYLTLAGTLSGHKRGVWNVAFSPVDKVRSFLHYPQSRLFWFCFCFCFCFVLFFVWSAREPLALRSSYVVLLSPWRSFIDGYFFCVCNNQIRLSRLQLQMTLSVFGH